jgi:hypothetical protein
MAARGDLFDQPFDMPRLSLRMVRVGDGHAHHLDRLAGPFEARPNGQRVSAEHVRLAGREPWLAGEQGETADPVGAIGVRIDIAQSGRERPVAAIGFLKQHDVGPLRAQKLRDRFHVRVADPQIERHDAQGEGIPVRTARQGC